MKSVTNLSFTNRSCTAIALLTAIAGLSLLDRSHTSIDDASHARRLLSTTYESYEQLSALRPGKPIMFTFFEPVVGGCCGMTEEGHKNLVYSWQRAWQSYGWETRILTEADARKHPRFQELEAKLEEADVNQYNRRCFWRWLAMSMDDSMNGGWMSDYDFFPLRLTSHIGKELATVDGFKSWSVHIPTIIHADQKSWNIMTDFMINTISKDLDVEFITDMYVLEYLYNHHTEEELNIVSWERLTYNGFPYKRKGDHVSVDCAGAMNRLGCHLSHHHTHEAVDNELFPKVPGVKEGDLNSSLNKRSDAANIMLRQFKEACFK